MARKGLLVSDPTVRTMTPAQWLFEYYALQDREEKETERYLKGLKGILVNVLGLNLKSNAANQHLSPEKRFEADLNEYTPLVLLAGNHHLLNKHFEDINQTSGLGDITGQSTVPDDQYEEQSKAIMDDMEPIDIPIARMSVEELNRGIENRGLNIKELDQPPLPIPMGSVIIKDKDE